MSGVDIDPVSFGFGGRILVLLSVICIISLWIMGVYFYISFSHVVGEGWVFIVLPLAFMIAPVVILLISIYRFKIILRYPYLINIPAFYTGLSKVPRERRGYWINRYFEILLALASTLSIYFLFLQYSIFASIITDNFPITIIVAEVIFPIILIGFLVFKLHKISVEMKREQIL